MRKILISLFAILTLVAIPAQFGIAAADDSSHHSEETVTHEDKAHGYRIAYPADWTTRKATSPAVIALFAKAPWQQGREGNALSVSYVKSAHSDKKLDLDAVLKLMESAASKRLKDFKVIEKPAKVSIAGLEGRRTVHSGKQADEIEVETASYCVETGDGRFFSLAIVCDPARHEEFEPTVTAIVKSFEVFKPE